MMKWQVGKRATKNGGAVSSSAVDPSAESQNAPQQSGARAFPLKALFSAARHGVSTAISARTKIPRHKIAGIAKAGKSCAEDGIHGKNSCSASAPKGASDLEIVFIIPRFALFVNQKFCDCLLVCRKKQNSCKISGRLSGFAADFHSAG
ncbi:MAG: hypothetical protein U0N62_09900 [Hydrogeniiclostridium sp.]